MPWLVEATRRNERLLTHVYHYSNVVRDVVFPDIDNKITSFGKGGIKSFLVIS